MPESSDTWEPASQFVGGENCSAIKVILNYLINLLNKNREIAHNLQSDFEFNPGSKFFIDLNYNWGTNHLHFNYLSKFNVKIIGILEFPN